MRILVLGANGFIGSYITAALMRENHQVVCAVRDVEATKLKFPALEVIKCDLNYDTSPDAWLEKLNGIDVVINVAGLLRSNDNNLLENVHFKGPKALFDACVQAKVKRIIHISALGVDDEISTDYARTKRAADSYLQNIKEIDWVILQPSLVYASGCYGGTSLLRALAVLPGFIPLVGNGEQKFQPIHIDDLTETILHFLYRIDEIRQVIKVVGPDKKTVKEILTGFRAWLGLKPAKLINIPAIFVQWLAKLGDYLGNGPLNSTSYHMMMHGNVADNATAIEATGILPRSFEQGLATEPLTIQSLWHARLYLLKPVIVWILGLFWIGTGLITGIVAPELGLKIIYDVGFSDYMAKIVLYASCVLDVILGILLVARYQIKRICVIQIAMVIVYTLVLTILKPALWLEPLGPLTKNIPIILLTLVLLAIERDK